MGKKTALQGSSKFSLSHMNKNDSNYDKNGKNNSNNDSNNNNNNDLVCKRVLNCHPRIKGVKKLRL